MDESALASFQGDYLWALIVGFILAFTLGFGMGANDVSNAFGTSVGSKVLSLRMAYILATIFEALGAVLVGFHVSDSMRKNVVDIDMYKNEPNELLLGQIAILGAGSIWLLFATYFKAPISTTHSIVGATLGFSLLLRGFDGIQWSEVIKIGCSWIVAPILSGLVSCIMYIIVDLTVLRKKDPINAGMKALPFIYFVCLAFNAFTIVYGGSKILNLSDTPLWLAVVISFGIGLVSGLVFYFCASPFLLRWVEKDDNTSKDIDSPMRLGHTTIQIQTVEEPAPKSFETNSTAKMFSGRKQKFSLSPKRFIGWFLPDRKRKEDHKTFRLFSAIQVFTACFAGFAHGANDIANAIAPVTSMFYLYKNGSIGETDQTPIYILLYGVLAACVGLWILGHRVIKTVGQKMSAINPVTGFTIEFGAAVAALLASKAGLPISTSHCLVGSVVAVGCIRTGKGVDWKIFKNVVLSWIITLPISLVLSLGIMFILKLVFL